MIGSSCRSALKGSWEEEMHSWMPGQVSWRASTSRASFTDNHASCLMPGTVLESFTCSSRCSTRCRPSTMPPKHERCSAEGPSVKHCCVCSMCSILLAAQNHARCSWTRKETAADSTPGVSSCAHWFVLEVLACNEKTYNFRQEFI